MLRYGVQGFLSRLRSRSFIFVLMFSISHALITGKIFRKSSHFFSPLNRSRARKAVPKKTVKKAANEKTCHLTKFSDWSIHDRLGNGRFYNGLSGMVPLNRIVKVMFETLQQILIGLFTSDARFFRLSAPPAGGAFCATDKLCIKSKRAHFEKRARVHVTCAVN